MWMIFAIIVIIVSLIMAFVSYRQGEQKKIEAEQNRRIEEEKEKEKKKKAAELKKRIEIVNAELAKADELIVNAKNAEELSDCKSKLERLKEENNDLVDELYNLTGEKLPYKGGLAAEFRYMRRETVESNKIKKQKEQEELIQQQIQRKQQQKAETAAAIAAGLAISKALSENSYTAKQRRREKELKELKEMLKKEFK